MKRSKFREAQIASVVTRVADRTTSCLRLRTSDRKVRFADVAVI